MFEIDARLRGDCHRLGRLPLCHVLLFKNRQLPWFILVPEVSQVEIIDLKRETRQRLYEETEAVAAFVQKDPRAQKLNVAAIGNLVRQLHVHVVGRSVEDPCWPGVVWGRLTSDVAYPEDDVANIKRELTEQIGLAADVF